MPPRPDEDFMRLALAAARDGVLAGQSPFGAAVVRGGEVLALAHNTVLADTDPTAHAEVRAIRTAAGVAQDIHLGGATIYSTTEPCPMCFAAIHWSRISRIVFAAAIADAAAAGFNELRLGNERLVQLTGSPIQIVPGVLAEEAVELFREWQLDEGHRAY